MVNNNSIQTEAAKMASQPAQIQPNTTNPSHPFSQGAEVCVHSLISRTTQMQDLAQGRSQPFMDATVEAANKRECAVSEKEFIETFNRNVSLTGETVHFATLSQIARRGNDSPTYENMRVRELSFYLLPMLERAQKIHTHIEELETVSQRLGNSPEDILLRNAVVQEYQSTARVLKELQDAHRLNKSYPASRLENYLKVLEEKLGFFEDQVQRQWNEVHERFVVEPEFSKRGEYSYRK